MTFGERDIVPKLCGLYTKWLRCVKLRAEKYARDRILSIMLYQPTNLKLTGNGPVLGEKSYLC
jgi:hypothetical protein